MKVVHWGSGDLTHRNWDDPPDISETAIPLVVIIGLVWGLSHAIGLLI